MGTFLGGGGGGVETGVSMCTQISAFFFFLPEMTLFVAVSGNTTTTNVVYFD